MKYARHEAKTWAREALRGHVVTTTTPYNAGKLDEAGLRDNVRRLLALPSVGGIYINSVFQEPTALSQHERRRVVEVICSEIDGAVPAICVAHGPSIDETIASALHAQESGADLVMLWPPTFGYRTADGVREYLSRVAGELEIGVCLYASGLSEFGYQLTIQDLAELTDLENVCAVKEASLSLGSYLDTLKALGDRVIISCPLDEYWLVAKRLVPSVAPDVLLGTSRPLYMESKERPYLSDLWNAAMSPWDYDAESALAAVVKLANSLHNRFLEAGTHNIALAKAASGMRGLASGGVRPPMSNPTVGELDDLRLVMAGAGLC